MPQPNRESPCKRQEGRQQVDNRTGTPSHVDLLPTMLEWRQAGLSQQAIADRLNDEGQTTRRGKPWNQVQVMRVLERATQPA